MPGVLGEAREIQILKLWKNKQVLSRSSCLHTPHKSCSLELLEGNIHWIRSGFLLSASPSQLSSSCSFWDIKPGFERQCLHTQPTQPWFHVPELVLRASTLQASLGSLRGQGGCRCPEGLTFPPLAGSPLPASVHPAPQPCLVPHSVRASLTPSRPVSLPPPAPRGPHPAFITLCHN